MCLVLMLQLGSCSKDPVEAPPHSHTSGGTNNGNDPDDPDGNASNDPETKERIEVMLSDATLRFDTPVGTVVYTEPGALFMKSTDDRQIEAIDLSKGVSVALTSPYPIESMILEGNIYPNVLIIESSGWHLVENGTPVEFTTIELMQANSHAVWLRFQSSGSKCHWAVIPRRW